MKPLDVFQRLAQAGSAHWGEHIGGQIDRWAGQAAGADKDQ
jgi:hypothetical protein